MNSDNRSVDLNKDNGEVYEFRNTEKVVNEWIENNEQSLAILDRDEAQIQADLVLRKEDKQNILTDFLHNQNMMIHHKKLLCMSKCYSDTNIPTRDILESVKVCKKGEDRFNTFVTKLFGCIILL